MTFSKIVPKIRFFRDQTGLTQRELAELLQVSEGTIANWERGEGDLRWIQSVDRLCRIFGCQPNELYEDIPVHQLENKKKKKSRSIEDYRKLLNTDIPSIEDQSSTSVDDD